MSDQAEYEWQDGGDAKRAKTEQQAAPEPDDEDMEAQFLRQLEEEEKKEKAAAAALVQWAEKKKNEWQEEQEGSQQAEQKAASGWNEEQWWASSSDASSQQWQQPAEDPSPAPAGGEAQTPVAGADDWQGDAESQAKQQSGNDETVAGSNTSANDAGAEMPADSAGRAAEWSNSMDNLADAEGYEEEKKPPPPPEYKGPETIVLHFNANCATKIVGRAGKNITKVREQSGADVKSRKDPDCIEVTIVGHGAGRAQKARQMIVELAGEEPNPYFAKSEA